MFLHGHKNWSSTFQEIYNFFYRHIVNVLCYIQKPNSNNIYTMNGFLVCFFISKFQFTRLCRVTLPAAVVKKIQPALINGKAKKKENPVLEANRFWKVVGQSCFIFIFPCIVNINVSVKFEDALHWSLETSNWVQGQFSPSIERSIYKKKYLKIGK